MCIIHGWYTIMKKKKQLKKPKVRNLVHKHAHELNRCKFLNRDRTKYTRKGKQVKTDEI